MNAKNRITYSNELIGVVHHGYEHVQQHDKRDDVVGTKHSGPNKLCELMSGFHIGDVEIQQSKHRPEERLEGLEKSGKTNKQNFTWLLGSGKWKSMPLGTLDLLRMGVTWCERSIGSIGSTPSLGAPTSGGEYTNIRSWSASVQYRAQQCPLFCMHSSPRVPLANDCKSFITSIKFTTCLRTISMWDATA